MANRFLDLLAAKPYLLADGAMGTNLFALGLPNGGCPELWNVEQPAKVQSVHAAFIEAGSDIVLTNSFGGTRYRLKLHEAEGRVAELNRAAARNARAAADAAGRPVAVAGSMGPTGELFEPLGTLTHAAAVEAFAEQAAALAEGGSDVLWVETMSSREEVAAAVAGAQTTGLPVVATMTFDTNGRTMMGLQPADAVGVYHAAHPGLAAYGANCGNGAGELVAAVLGLSAAAAPGDVIVAKGNCGIPAFVDGHIHYTGTPEVMAEYAVLARSAGARIIGGCCGSTALHVRAMAQALAAAPPRQRPTLAEVEAALGLNRAAGPSGDAPQRRSRRRA